MVTEVLVWAIILTNRNNAAVEVYDNELLCRQEMRELELAVPQARLKCVPRYSTRRPGNNEGARRLE
jgi:hypothetical protein